MYAHTEQSRAIRCVARSTSAAWSCDPVTGGCASANSCEHRMNEPPSGGGDGTVLLRLLLRPPPPQQLLGVAAAAAAVILDAQELVALEPFDDAGPPRPPSGAMDALKAMTAEPHCVRSTLVVSHAVCAHAPRGRSRTMTDATGPDGTGVRTFARALGSRSRRAGCCTATLSRAVKTTSLSGRAE